MIAVTSPPPATRWVGASAVMVVNSRLRVVNQSRNMAISTPQSPIRFIRKAFLPASALALSPYQKPIRR